MPKIMTIFATMPSDVFNVLDKQEVGKIKEEIRHFLGGKGFEPKDVIIGFIEARSLKHLVIECESEAEQLKSFKKCRKWAQVIAGFFYEISPFPVVCTVKRLGGAVNSALIVCLSKPLTPEK